MRGKPAASTCWRVLSGITPADAGKTNPVFNVDFAYRDHPRGCGENSFLLIWDLRWSGSPPRMRGKRTHISKTVIRPGITPADAGKTAPFYCLYVTTGDHPRGCGENLYQSLYKLLFSGSPPRMRGKLPLPGGNSFITGITPADAGKTKLPALLQFLPQDHPRGCGENGAVCSDTKIDRGSPPRMRGKLPTACSKTSISRITPADAGKT